MRRTAFLNIVFWCILLVFLLLSLNFVLLIKIKIDKSMAGAFNLHAQTETFRPNHIGERIIYDVKLGKLYLGEARFANIANARLNGRILSVMVLETELTRFIDREKIYSDPQTLLPIRVERDILGWFVQEKITEEYDQNNFSVTIIKNKGGILEETVLKKDSPIHNAVLLPYYVRRIPSLEVGKIIIANLPTRRLEIKLVSLEEIEVPAGTFLTYHFTSVPKEIAIWISADERRLPVKIQGTGIFGYSLVMKEYSF